MPFQLDKKKLMIGGGLLVLVIIVVIIVVMMKKKSPQPQPVQAANSRSKATTTSLYVFPTQSVILNPTASGNYYLTHGNKFLNITNYNLEATPKTPIRWNMSNYQITNTDGSNLEFYGHNVMLIPVKNYDSIPTGVVLNKIPTQQTYFPVSADGSKITTGVDAFPNYDTGYFYPLTTNRKYIDVLNPTKYGVRADTTIQGPDDPNLANSPFFLFGLIPA